MSSTTRPAGLPSEKTRPTEREKASWYDQIGNRDGRTFKPEKTTPKRNDTKEKMESAFKHVFDESSQLPVDKDFKKLSQGLIVPDGSVHSQDSLESYHSHEQVKQSETLKDMFHSAESVVTKLTTIKQGCKTSCGLTCVAMILGDRKIKDPQLKREIQVSAPTDDNAEIRDYLNTHRIGYNEVSLKNLEGQNKTILVKGIFRGNSHWIVIDKVDKNLCSIRDPNCGSAAIVRREEIEQAMKKISVGYNAFVINS